MASDRDGRAGLSLDLTPGSPVHQLRARRAERPAARAVPRTIKVNGIERQSFDYLARGVPYRTDDGTIAPWAVVASLPLAIVLPAIDHLVHQVDLKIGNPYGFEATFSPTYPDESGNRHGSVSPWHHGINQGPLDLMKTIERICCGS